MKISDILAFLEEESVPFTFVGDQDTEVERFSSLVNYKPRTFTWVNSAQNIPQGFDLSQITLAFVSEGVEGDFRNVNVIYTPRSKFAFFSTIEHFYYEEDARPSIGQFTYISPRVKLGKNVRIGHNCTLDGDIEIGDNTVIWNSVVIINRVRIGKNCDIHSNVTIGHDGFGYSEDEAHIKTMVRHFGGVEIGDSVTLMEGINVSRGTIDDTIIGNGVKIDANSHIGHNSIIGDHVGFAMFCELCGSVHIGEGAYLAGATVINQSTIGKNAYLGFRSVIIRDIEENETVFGYPARKIKQTEVHEGGTSGTV